MSWLPADNCSVFRPPLYLWQVCDGGGYQAGRTLQSVGCLLPGLLRAGTTGVAAGSADTAVDRTGGVQQLLNNDHHDFLLRLAHQLAEGGIVKWKTALKPLLAGGAFSCLQLRGLMFSPPLTPAPEAAITHGCHRRYGWA